MGHSASVSYVGEVPYICPETTTLLAHLGRPLPPLSTLPTSSGSSASRPVTPSHRSHLGPEEDDETKVDWPVIHRPKVSRRLEQLVEELVVTERSYIGRIRALKEVWLFNHVRCIRLIMLDVR